MNITIYGTRQCPYCSMAKDYAGKLPGANVEYIDMQQQRISQADLSEKLGKETRSVPQILINGHHIGGYTELVRMTGDLT